MIVSLRVTAIVSVMFVLTSTAVMAQTTGTSPSQPPSYEAALPPQPPATGQFSPDELIDTGSHFCASVVSHLRGMTCTSFQRQAV